MCVLTREVLHQQPMYASYLLLRPLLLSTSLPPPLVARLAQAWLPQLLKQQEDALDTYSKVTQLGEVRHAPPCCFDFATPPWACGCSASLNPHMFAAAAAAALRLQRLASEVTAYKTRIAAVVQEILTTPPPVGSRKVLIKCQ